MERALLVTVDFRDDINWTAAERQEELAELALSAGAKVVDSVIVRRNEPSPAYFIGEGKVEELAGICKSRKINVVIFNNDLAGTQQKNLESAMEAKVIDRTQLILDIFARRAHSEEGKIQVELAQLLYLLPRLTGKGVELSRLGGGIGTRGPGEQKLEIDRRRIRTKISRLKDRLEDISGRRAMMRLRREKFSILTIAIIGYTNVGKSTLINALTDSSVIVKDKLFATLDPTIRRFILPNNQKVLFVDTVGFVNDLPHHLVEAFKATLEEVVEADILLHVVDISHPKAMEQIDAVYKVLDDIDAKEKKIITVLNKIDKVKDLPVDRFRERLGSAVAISALKRENFDGLINAILEYSKETMIFVKLKVPSSDTRTLSLIHENGYVIKKEYTGNDVSIEAEIPKRMLDIIKNSAKVNY